jgi:L-lactate dehydrogenase (cytochrome)
MLSGLEVARHNSRDSCWIIVKGNVYDVTDYLDSHPGGNRILLNYAGKVGRREQSPAKPVVC